MEEKYHPGSSYQNLFNYLHEEHGLTLLESEMNDLINVVHKFHPADDAGLTASDYEDILSDHRRLVRELDIIMNGDNAAPQASLIDIVCQLRNEWPKRQAAVWVNCNDKLPKDDSWEDFPCHYILKGHNDGRRGEVDIHQVTFDEMKDVIRAYDWCEWLDEQRAPAAAREGDAVEFAEWALNEGWESRKGKGWMKHSDETPYVLTTAQLYELFKKHHP